MLPPRPSVCRPWSNLRQVRASQAAPRQRNGSAFDDRAVYDAFYEVTETGAIVWEWDARRPGPHYESINAWPKMFDSPFLTHLPPQGDAVGPWRREFPWDQHQREHWFHTGDCSQVWQLQKKDCIDWMHGNTVYWDFEDDVICPGRSRKPIVCHLHRNYPDPPPKWLHYRQGIS